MIRTRALREQLSEGMTCQWDSNPHLPDNSGTLLSRLSPSPVFIPGCDMAGKNGPTSPTPARAENFTAGAFIPSGGRPRLTPTPPSPPPDSFAKQRAASWKCRHDGRVPSVGLVWQRSPAPAHSSICGREKDDVANHPFPNSTRIPQGGFISFPHVSAPPLPDPPMLLPSRRVPSEAGTAASKDDGLIRRRSTPWPCRGRVHWGYCVPCLKYLNCCIFRSLNGYRRIVRILKRFTIQCMGQVFEFFFRCLRCSS